LWNLKGKRGQVNLVRGVAHGCAVYGAKDVNAGQVYNQSKVRIRNAMANRLQCLFILLVVSFNVLAGESESPTDRVKNSIGQVILILKIPGLDRETRWQQIAKVLRKGFDFRSMSQSVLATQWKKASPEEQERFTEFFSQYLEDTYRTKIEGYTDQEILYKDEIIRGNRAVVETVIVTSSTEIPINYKLRNNDGEWYAYDVVIEGISLVSNYRNTFAAIVKNEGMEGLISDIQRRIDKFKAKQAKQEQEQAKQEQAVGS